MDTPSSTLLLAPAAGHGVGKLLAESLLADPDFLRLLKGAFLDSLQATVVIYDKGSKGWVPHVDYKTRLGAAVAVLAHMEGDPIKRIIHQHLGSGSETAQALLDELATSPGLRAAMRRKLAEAEARAAAGAIAAAPAQVEAE